MAASIPSPSPDALIESFPTPTLPNIEGEPTYPQLAAILKEIKANAASVPSVQGGGSNGHLGIVVSDAVYATIAPGTPFIKPTNPAQHPTIPRTSTDGAITSIMRRHNERQREFREYNNVQRALKKQLATAIDGIYLEAHKDNNVGYENVSIEVLLQYLFDEYGDITPVDLRANAKRLDEEWDPSQPIQTLYSRIKEIQTYAQAGNRTFTDQQIVDAAYTIIYKTGVYYDDCDDWLETTPQHQTWINFQKHFNAAHRKAKRKQRTTQSEGYHSANAALQTNDNLQAENEATTEALANMATAMSADRTTMGQLTNAIADLTAQLSARDQEITTLKSQLRGNNSGTNNTTNSNRESSQRTTWVNGKHRRDRGGYCWTHGFLVAKDAHTSANCNAPKQGHKNEATRNNTMGGNEFGKPKT
jgi:hypothetical protein